MIGLIKVHGSILIISCFLLILDPVILTTVSNWYVSTEHVKEVSCHHSREHLKALVFLYAFEESVDCHLLSSFCDDSNLHISLFTYVLSTMGVSKESISKFLIGNRFHVKLRIHSPYSNRIILSPYYASSVHIQIDLNKDWGCVILREIDFLLKICWSIPCLHPSWKVHTLENLHPGVAIGNPERHVCKASHRGSKQQ